VSAPLGVRFKLFSQFQVLFVIMVTPKGEYSQSATPEPARGQVLDGYGLLPMDRRRITVWTGTELDRPK
jgi:hypothetical protein